MTWGFGSVGPAGPERAVDKTANPTLSRCDPKEKGAEFRKLNPWALLARLAGIEPTTLGFGGQYSIH